MDPSEPHWRTNSSFSPPLSRTWDGRFQSDGLSDRIHEAPQYGSSQSSHSKGSRSGLSSDRYLNHQHSVSDGALSYLGSPADSFQAPRWMPPVQRYDLGEFSTPAGGAKPDTSVFSHCNEKSLAAGISIGSASPTLESNQWASTSKQPIFLAPCHFSGRRSFISKPVHPLVFRNPVSDAEASGAAGTSTGGRMTPRDDSRTSTPCHGNFLSPGLKFHKTLTELQKMGHSPDLGTSSRREGFRWSNGSSYDLGFDGDAIDITDHIGLENQRCPNNSARYQKCGLCERLLWQKSPWSSHRIVRSSDMPITGVLPCRHVFHADCLEETTPKSQIHDPPCPLCLKAPGEEGSTSFSEPLRVTLRSLRRSQGAKIASSGTGSGNIYPSPDEGDFRRNQSLPLSRRGGSLKKRFSFKGKMGRDLFGSKLFRRAESSSSLLHNDLDQSGHTTRQGR